MNRRIIIFSSILLLVVLIVSILVLHQVLKNTNIELTIEEQIKQVKKIDEYKRNEIGFDYNTIFDKYDTVKFGKYYQDKDSNNKTDIEWFVLDKKDDYALLLSKYILDVNKISDSEEECQWSETILRKWLNNDFYDIAFNDVEKEKIIKCELDNFNIPLSLHKKQGKTKDKVFILSLDELQTYFYHISSSVAETATTATEYAFSKGSLINYQQMKQTDEFKQIVKELNSSTSIFDINTSTYWTRTFKDNKCIIIDYNGNFKGDLDRKSNLTQKNGVRPAIWINYNNVENINELITYDMFKKDENLTEPNEEYDLSKTPSELNLYKKGEKNAYYKQLIEKKLEPEKLKNFIDVDQLENIHGITVDELLQEIKNLAYKNVISELLKSNVDFYNLPVTGNLINNHPNLLSELKNLSDKYSVKNNGVVNTRKGMHLTVSVYNVSIKTGHYKGGYGLTLFFDGKGNIDELDIIELKY